MAVRAITFSLYRAHTQPLFEELKLLNIYHLHKLSVCTFMFDLVHDKLPHAVKDYCSIIQHNYST